MQKQTTLANELWPLLAPRVAALVAGANAGGSGGGGAAATVGQHDLGGSLHTGTLRSEQAPQFLLTTGLRELTGNLAVASGVTIDGVDLDVHAANPDAHHARQHGILSANDHTVTGSAYQIIGVTATDTLGLLTPSSDVRSGAAEAILKSDAAGSLGVKGLTVGSGVTISGLNNVNTAPDIQFGLNGLLAAESNLYFAVDSNASGTGFAFIFGHDSATVSGTFTELARLTDASVLRFTGSAPTISTAANDLTIAPAGDLLLSPGGLDAIITQASALRSDNYLKTILIAGFRIGPTSVSGQTGVEAGSGEFDELRARTFVADETRVDRGQEYVTKSYGVLSRAFTVPASVGGTAYLYVENSPHIVGAVFTANDWVLLRYLDMSSGIVLTSVWGQVTAYNVTGLTGEQRWTFTLRQGTGGLAFAKGALVTDFGQSGQGYILTDAVTATSPFVQVGRWSGSDPYTPANYSVLTQIGRLDGVGFTGEYGLAAAVTGFADTDAFVKITTSAAQMNNVPIYMYSSGINTGAWYANGQLYAGFDGIGTQTERDFSIATDFVRVGRSSGSNPNLYWSKSAGALYLRSGGVAKIILDTDGNSYFAGVMTIGTSGEIRQGTGTLGSDYTGLRIWRDSDVGRIGGYKSNTLQWYADTGGELRAGGGLVSVAADGFGMARYETTVGTPISGTESRAALAWWDDMSARTGAPLARVYAARSDAGTGAYPMLSVEVDPANANANLRPSIWLVGNRAGFGPVLWLNNIYGVVGLPGIYPSRNTSTLADTVQFSGSLYFEAHLLRDPGNTNIDVGTAGNPFRTLYVSSIVADTITGGTSISGSIWQNDAGDMYVRSSSASARTLYVANPGAGLMHLDVEGSITVGGNVDGVDVSGFKGLYDTHVASANAHHNQAHVLATNAGLGADHSISGATAGHVLRASGATTAQFAQLAHGDLSGVGANDHHNQSHVLASTSGLGADHTVSGLTAGYVLRASGATTAQFAQLGHGDLGSVTADQHHAQQHAITGSDHTVTGSQYQLVGLTGTNTLGLLTPSSNPGSASAILRTNAGALTLAQLTISAAGYLYVDGTLDFGTNTLYEDATYLQMGGAKPFSIGGAVIISPRNSVSVAPDIQFASNGFIAAETSLYISLDSDNDTTNSALIIGNNSPITTGFVTLFTFNEAGEAIISTKVRVPLIDTASGHLTLEPAVDLLLKPGSNLVKLQSGVALQSHNYASQTTGMRVTNDGQADFRYLYADEMHVKSFIADLEQALAGGQIISKSVAILGSDFTVPAAGGVATLHVLDLPSAPGMAVFQDGDIVRLRSFSRAAGSLSVADCWGVVTSYVDLLNGSQIWTFTRSAAPNAGAMTAGAVVYKDALALDYGTTGNGFYEVNAIDGAYAVNSPYLQFVRWTTHPATGSAVRLRAGQLKGIFAQDEFGLFAGTGTGNDDRWLRLSDYAAGNGINNLPFRMYASGVEAIHFGAWNDIWWGPSSADKRLSWDGSTFAIVGQVTATSGTIANWNIGTVDANTISAAAIRLIAGGGGVGRIEVGTSGDNYAGIISRTTNAVTFWAGKSYAQNGSAPFRVTLGGDLYASSADITGAIKATSGYIGGAANGWTITANASSGLLSSTNIRLISGDGYTARVELGDGVTAAATAGIRAGLGTAADVAFWAGAAHDNTGAAPFSVTLAGGLTATSADITGAITANTGYIGGATGWTVTTGKIYSDNMEIAAGASARIVVGGSTSWAGIHNGSISNHTIFWAGSAYGDRASAPFRVWLNGRVYATDAFITGDVRATSGYIGGSTDGWVIGAGAITSNNIGLYSGAAGTARIEVGSSSNMAGIVSGTAAGDVVMWAGSTYANRANVGTPFRVQANGAFYSTAATLDNVSIISGTITQLRAGASAVQLGTDGQRFVLPNVTSVDVPTSSSALRWFPTIDGTHDATKNYTGLVGYRHTSYNAVDMLYTSYVGSTDYATYAARFILQAGHYDGATYTDTRLEIVREAGSGARYMAVYGERLELADGSLGLKPITAPATWASGAVVYLDTSDGDLKVKFSNGTVKTLATN